MRRDLVPNERVTLLRPGEDTVSISNRSAPHQRQRHRANGIIRRDRHPHHSFVGRSRVEVGDRVPSENETGQTRARNPPSGRCVT